MEELIEKTESIFERIKHIDEAGKEYWEARELQKALEYKEWRKFKGVIDKAIENCKNSNISIFEQFVHVDKPIVGGNGNIQIVLDYKLSRYACYIIALNGDPRKKIIALAKTYFAIQTRRQEIDERELIEDSLRLINRKEVRNANYKLNRIAINSGVRDFAEFHNAGYKGLYNGETADDIFKRKKLRYREDILDNMNSTELAANLFRITQTKDILEKSKIDNQYEANATHYKVGREVRNTIKRLNGTMPEKLPTPKRSLKDIEKNELKKVNFGGE